MNAIQQAAADLAEAGNLHFRLAELLEQHGTQAVVEALALACQGAAEGPGQGAGYWDSATRKLRGTGLTLGLAEKRSNIVLEDACRVLADMDL